MELDTQIAEDEYLYFHVKNITAKGIYTVILISAIIAYDPPPYSQNGIFVTRARQNFLFPKYPRLTCGVARASSILGTLHIRFLRVPPISRA